MVTTPSPVAPFAAPMWRSSARSFLAPPARIAIVRRLARRHRLRCRGDRPRRDKRDATRLLHLGDFGYNFNDT
jgi:hypothetical protein